MAASDSVGGSAYLLTVRGDGKRYKFSILTGAKFDGISYQAAFQPPAGEVDHDKTGRSRFCPNLARTRHRPPATA